MSTFENVLWNRSKYESLENNSNNAGSRSIVTSIIVGLFGAILIMAMWNMSFHRSSRTLILRVDSSSPMLHKISPKFLSFGLDSSLLRNMTRFPINDERFINLAKHLSPAFARFGGTSADCLFFNRSISDLRFSPSRENNGNISMNIGKQDDISNFTLSENDFSNMYDFTKKSGIKMMFDLNVLIRTNQGEWDDSNAKEIIGFSKGHDMDIDWQLGNEPNSFKHVFDRPISAEQLARDYQHLRILLNKMGYSSSILVGPEANHIDDAANRGEIYAQKFLENDGDSVDFVTWHQYYLNGRTANILDFLSPKIFNQLPGQIEVIQNMTKKSGKKIKMWISETSTAYGGGAPGLSDRFVAGFLWLDKLGYSASAGVNVVVRQSLFGGDYAMVGKDLLPNPDWWISVIFKQLVSEIVLQLKTKNNFGTLRFYAHCTPKSALINRVPALTLYGMNLDNKPSQIFVEGNWIDKNAKILLYTLTSDNLSSRNIRMNNEILKLNPDGSLPAFRPIIIEPSQKIYLPPTSMTFIVIHGAEIPACTMQLL